MAETASGSSARPAFRSLRSGAVGQSMRSMLENRLITAESEYRGALEQYRGAMRLQRRINNMEHDGRTEQAEQLKVRLMNELHKGGGEEGRQALKDLEQEVVHASGGGEGIGSGVGGGGVVGHVEDVPDVADRDSAGSGTSGSVDGKKRAAAAAGAGGGGFKKAIFISVCAWVFALAMLCVSVTFLTKSFVDSQRNPVITRTFEESNELDLPAISICSTNVDVPSFYNYPQGQYKGRPLFTLNEVNYLENDTVLEFPETLEQFDVRVLGPSREECQDRMNFIDANLATQSTGQVVMPTRDAIRCSACLTIGASKPIKVKAARAREGLPSGISVNVVMSRLYAYCFIETPRILETTKSIFQAEFMREREGLIERGILDFGGLVNTSDTDEVLGALVVQPSEDDELMELDQIDFYCNVYFFSGYFYPTKETPDMKYRLVSREFPQKWLRVNGTKGPYYEIAKQSTLERILTQEDLGLKPTEGQRDTFSFLNTVALSVYAEESKDARADENGVVNTSSLVAQIDRNKGALVRFRQQGTISTRSTFRVAVLSLTDDRPQPSSAGPFFSNRLNFTFDRFLREELIQQETYSVWRFVADLLEVLTLFTGLSFYSVIVVPATAFLVQRQRRRRRQAIQAALAENARNSNMTRSSDASTGSSTSS